MQQLYGDDTEEGSETEGAEVLDEGDRVKMTGKQAAPGEVHTVTKGDTLWDLSQRYLGSPWYWPKVWSYNPDIANPHWIYPGNLVRFFPAGDEVPTQVEVGNGPSPATAMEESIDGVDAMDAIPDESDEVQVSGKIGYTPKEAVRLNHVSFVTAKELEESGRIDSSFAESEMLSYPDTAYVAFKNRQAVKNGDRYVIFKTLTEVKHPITGANIGYMTEFLGTMRVIGGSEKLVTAAIETTRDEVRRGDLVGPYGEQLHKNVAPRANDRDLKGYVVTTTVPSLTLIGENQMIIVDKGSSDGVQPGNTFIVIRQSNMGGSSFMDPTVSDSRYPPENIAECMAVDVKDKATTCLMTRSIREVAPGDRVEMRASKAANPPRASLR
jgi:hypothetical protein